MNYGKENNRNYENSKKEGWNRRKQLSFFEKIF